MATVPAVVSLSKYLNTNYEPDCEYLDGVLAERNVGKRKHSRTQRLLLSALAARLTGTGYEVLPEQRVQTSPGRVRIPDVCVVPANADDEVIPNPPELWIEILSPGDIWSRVQTKLRDVRAFGVRNIWVIDPYEREAWVSNGGELAPVENGTLECKGPDLEIPLDEILP